MGTAERRWSRNGHRPGAGWRNPARRTCLINYREKTVSSNRCSAAAANAGQYRVLAKPARDAAGQLSRAVQRDLPVRESVDEERIAHPHPGEGAQVGLDSHIDCYSRIGEAHVDVALVNDDPSYADWEWLVAHDQDDSRVTITVDLSPTTFWRKYLFVRIRRPAPRKKIRDSLRALATADLS